MKERCQGFKNNNTKETDQIRSYDPVFSHTQWVGTTTTHPKAQRTQDRRPVRVCNKSHRCKPTCLKPLENGWPVKQWPKSSKYCLCHFFSALSPSVQIRAKNDHKLFQADIKKISCVNYRPWNWQHNRKYKTLSLKTWAGHWASGLQYTLCLNQKMPKWPLRHMLNVAMEAGVSGHWMGENGKWQTLWGWIWWDRQSDRQEDE